MMKKEEREKNQPVQNTEVKERKITPQNQVALSGFSNIMHKKKWL